VTAVLLYYISQKKKIEEMSFFKGDQELASLYQGENLSNDYKVMEKSEEIRKYMRGFLKSPLFFSYSNANREEKYNLQLYVKILSNNKMMLSIKLSDKQGSRFVPDIKEFVQSYEKQDFYLINKIAYSLKNDYFSAESTEMFDVLKDVILNHDPSSNYNQRDISLPVFITNRLMDRLKYWREVYNYKNEKLFVCEHDYIFTLKLEFEFQKLKVIPYVYSAGEKKSIAGEIYLTNETMYFISDENIFLLIALEPETKKIMEFLKKEFVVPEELIPNFLVETLPKIENIININKPERLKNINMIQEKVKPKLYLEYDKKNNKIISMLTFLYGDYELTNILNPYSEKRVFIGGEKPVWIHRDYLSENRCYSQIRKWKFKKIDFDVFQLIGDENIFEFMFDIVPEIKNEWEIHYHQNFQQLKVMKEDRVSVNISISKGLDFFEVFFSVPGTDIKIALKELIKSGKETRFVKLDDNSFIPLDKKELGFIKEVIHEFSEMNEDEGHVSISKGLYLLNRLKSYHELSVSFDERVESFYNNIIQPKSIDLGILPQEYYSLLRDYQKKGLSWIINLSSYHLGGVLADDMGLGKTIQAIGALFYDALQGNNKPNLVICPTSLLYNWKNEITKFASGLKYQVIDGRIEERKEKIEKIEEQNINITSYALLRNDLELYQKHFFNYVILDEAQLIKNPITRNAKAAKSLICNKRLILTGTPIENSVTELWSLFDFLMPGFLFSHKRFRKIYEKPIILNQNDKVKNMLVSRISPFVLRRLKKDVLKDLPPKIEEYCYCELNDDEKKLYLKYLEESKEKINQAIQEKGFNQSRIEILAVLTRLRQICCHPWLLGEIFEKDFNTSSKLELLKELILEGIESNHKILIFSQFVKMLDIVKKLFHEIGIRYEYLTGASKDRIEKVRNFNENPDIPVFLISLKAGGTGLNLTSADIVIHFDPWWNPSVENQASDRAHRIGQENQVMIYKLITHGTIEEKIIELQNRKRDLIDSIITNQPGSGKFLSSGDIEELFKVSF